MNGIAGPIRRFAKSSDHPWVHIGGFCWGEQVPEEGLTQKAAEGICRQSSQGKEEANSSGLVRGDFRFGSMPKEIAGPSSEPKPGDIAIPFVYFGRRKVNIVFGAADATVERVRDVWTARRSSPTLAASDASELLFRLSQDDVGQRDLQRRRAGSGSIRRRADACRLPYRLGEGLAKPRRFPKSETTCRTPQQH